MSSSQSGPWARSSISPRDTFCGGRQGGLTLETTRTYRRSQLSTRRIAGPALCHQTAVVAAPRRRSRSNSPRSRRDG